MLKNILNLKGAQQLSAKEQKEINGGIPNQCIAAGINETGDFQSCPSGYVLMFQTGKPARCCAY